MPQRLLCSNFGNLGALQCLHCSPHPRLEEQLWTLLCPVHYREFRSTGEPVRQCPICTGSGHHSGPQYTGGRGPVSQHLLHGFHMASFPQEQSSKIPGSGVRWEVTPL